MIPIDSSTILLGAAFALLLGTLPVCYRMLVGPSVQDRVVALNVFGTNTAVVVALLAVGFDASGVIDIALVYGLLNFVTSIALARLTTAGGVPAWP